MDRVKKKLMFVVTEDWYFCSHRSSLAKRTKEQGLEIIVVTNVNKHGELIRSQGFKLISLPFKRSHRNPFRDLLTCFRLFSIYIKERPDILHHVALKPVIMGTLIARLCHVPIIINAYTGLGYLFSSDSREIRLLYSCVLPVIRIFINGKNVWSIFQNRQDRERLVKERLVADERAVLIKGSGVDIEKFLVTPEQDSTPRVLFASRLLKQKGIKEFVEAARRLQMENVTAEFVVVGGPDTSNPSSITTDEIDAWQKEGAIQWWGWRDDMEKILQQVHIVCLPTYYGEGLPKILIEAASAGRPIVATDIPGCNEIVRNGENGLLVKPRDINQLTEVLKTLILDKALRVSMGNKGRKIVESEFSDLIVNNQTIDLYESLLLENNI